MTPSKFQSSDLASNNELERMLETFGLKIVIVFISNVDKASLPFFKRVKALKFFSFYL